MSFIEKNNSIIIITFISSVDIAINNWIVRFNEIDIIISFFNTQELVEVVMGTI